MARLIDCHRCHVLIDGGKRKLEGMVIHKKENVKIYFALSALQDARVKTNVVFYDDVMGILHGECELLIRRNPADNKNKYPWMADCMINRLQMDENNRRQAIRVKTDIAITLSSQFHGSFLGTIKDLSVGGLLLETSQILSKDEEFYFSYNFGGGMQKFYAAPVRGLLGEGGRYRYGCQFNRLSEAGESVIGKYLFKRQQELRKQG